MHKTIRIPLFTDPANRRSFLFVIGWIVGLLAGTVFAVITDVSFLPLMRKAAACRVSIIGLMCTALLPFLFAAYAVFINRFELLLTVCVCKVFSFAYCAVLAARAFGSAGWLVQPLLQFTDICTVPVLCWFSLRHIRTDTVSLRTEFSVCLFLTAAAAGLDYFVVSPFLAKLIDI